MKMMNEQYVENGKGIDLNRMFNLQIHLQNVMFNKKLPVDSVEDFKYSILGLIAELGEVLEADKRWKNVRSGVCNRENKLDELVDCMAFLINAIIYSGFTADEFGKAFEKKNMKNFERIKGE